jgi:hypothetical protein
MTNATIETFQHRRAGHCASGALRDLLEHHRLSFGPDPISEGMVFGLAGGLGFYFFELAGVEPPIYLVGRTAELERDFARHLGIEPNIRQTDEPAEGWDWVRERLEAGEPTMVWADIKELDYLRVRMSNTMHCIVVVGYDEDESIALIADNDRDDLQRCSLDSLARARNSGGFPAPNRHAAWLMEFPAELPDLASIGHRAVLRAVDNMRDGGAAISAVPGSVGLAGVEAFAAAYPEWGERFGDQLEAALKALRVFIVKAGTGGAMFRSLHAQFLRETSELLSDRELGRAADVYERLSAAWVGLAQSTTVAPPASALLAGKRHVETIARLEHEGVEAMERWAGRAA